MHKLLDFPLRCPPLQGLSGLDVIDKPYLVTGQVAADQDMVQGLGFRVCDDPYLHIYT